MHLLYGLSHKNVGHLYVSMKQVQQIIITF